MKISKDVPESSRTEMSSVPEPAAAGGFCLLSLSASVYYFFSECRLLLAVPHGLPGGAGSYPDVDNQPFSPPFFPVLKLLGKGPVSKLVQLDRLLDQP